MGRKPKFKRGGRGLYCENMKELIEDANAVGLSDLDIAKNVGAAQSTVRNWWDKNVGDKKLAIKLYRLTCHIESGNSFDYSVEKDDRDTNIPHIQPDIEHSVEEAQFFKKFRQLSEEAKKIGGKITFEYSSRKD